MGVPGAKTLPGKRKLQKAATHRANSYGPMCKVKFVYKDDPKTPLKNRYVLYWLYNPKGTGLDSNPEDPGYWHRQGVFMPGGCGKTWGDGSLVKSHRLKGMVFVYDADGSRYLQYDRLPNENEEQSQISPIPHLSANSFPMGRKVGFLLLPPDVLTGFKTTDLRKMTASGAAWIGKITQDGQVIQIQCTLPEWMYRIKRELKLLKYHQARYANYVRKHLEAVTHVELMSTFIQYMIRYPAGVPHYKDVYLAKLMIDQLETLKKRINDAYVTDTDPSSQCGKLLSRIDNSAKSLWKLLKNKAFVDELKRYMPCVSNKLKEGEHGPDTKAEHGWKEIFDLLGQAYDALAKSSLGDKVYAEHVEKLFDYLALLSAEAHPSWPTNKGDLIKEMRKALPAKTFSMDDNPLLSVIDQYGSILQMSISDAPGPPCLVEAMINSYGLRISQKIAFGNTPTTMANLRRLFGFFKLLRRGMPLSEDQMLKIAEEAEFGELRSGEAGLFKYVTEAVGEQHSVTTVRVYHASMFFFAIVSFGATVTADDDITVRKWAKIIGASSNVGLTSMGIFFSAFEKAKLFKITAGSLGIIAGIAGIVISSIDAYQYFKEGDIGKGLVSVVAAGGSLALTVGFGIMAFGAGTSWTGVGTVLILIGVIVTVAAAIVMILISLFEKETQTAFAELRKAFSKEGTTYATEYVNAPAVKRAFEDVVSYENLMNWWLMSWRAIVPLYNMGFRVYDPTTKSEKLLATAEGIKRLIEGESGMGGEKVILAYLIEYKAAQKNPKQDLNKNGTPDFYEWQNGTIAPKRPPPVNTKGI